MIDQIKLAAIGLFAIVLFGIGWHFGDKKATEKYLPEIQQLKDAIDTADKEARKKQAEYKENNDEIQRQNDQRINDIREYYRKRVLQSVPSKTGSSSTPSGSETTDGTTTESTPIGQDFERRCVEDANKVEMFQTWVIKNKFPIEK